MYPYDPATDREIALLARRVLASYEHMMQANDDGAKTMKYLFEMLKEPEKKSMQEEFSSFLQSCVSSSTKIPYSQIQGLRARLETFVYDMSRNPVERSTWGVYVDIASSLLEEYDAMARRVASMREAAQSLGKPGSDPFDRANYAFEVTSQQVRAQLAQVSQYSV